MNHIYECNVCNYTTTIQYCYKKHLRTDKHNKNSNNGNGINEIIRSNSYICKYCNKTLDKSNKARHTRICIIEYNKIQDQIKLEQEKYEELLKLEREKAEILRIEQEREKQILVRSERRKAKKLRIKEKQHQNKMIQDIIITVLKNAGATNITNNNTNITNSNNSVTNCPNFNYIKKNFTNPMTLEECLKPPLTQIEKDNITKTNPTVGCEYLIMNRCVNNVDLDQRPIHNIDIARNRFAVYCGVDPNKSWVSKDGKYIVGKFIPLIASQYKDKLEKAEGNDCLNIAKDLHDLNTTGKKKVAKSISDLTYIKNTLTPKEIGKNIAKKNIKASDNDSDSDSDSDSDGDVDSDELNKIHDKIVKKRSRKTDMMSSIMAILNSMTNDDDDHDHSHSDSDHSNNDHSNSHSDSDNDYYNEL